MEGRILAVESSSNLDQKTAFKMGINGHTRFDLYSSCTVVQGTLKISP